MIQGMLVNTSVSALYCLSALFQSPVHKERQVPYHLRPYNCWLTIC